MPSQPITSTLETPRLILRRFTPADAPAVARMCNDEEIHRRTLSLPWPYTLECAETWIAGHDEAIQRGCYDYAVTDRATGELLGCIGIFCTLAHGYGELGYWFGREHWGNGYATEAAQALIRAAFSNCELHRVFGRHFVTNPASGRVMQKCGMTCEGTLRQHLRKDDHYEDVVCYGLLRSDWEANQQR